MAYYVLHYEQLVDDYLERRGAYRAEHLGLARRATDAGSLRLGGALADPADSALLVFEGDDPSVATRFAEADPYVRNGLVVRWRVREWTVVIGADYGGPVPTG